MYHELKERIKNWYQKARDNGGGYNKELDDILQEMDINANCFNCIPLTSKKHYIYVKLGLSDGDDKKSFLYHNQCQKLDALRDAAFWLLDHSDIKKDLCGTEQKIEIEGKTYKAKILEEV